MLPIGAMLGLDSDIIDMNLRVALLVHGFMAPCFGENEDAA